MVVINEIPVNATIGLDPIEGIEPDADPWALAEQLRQLLSPKGPSLQSLPHWL